VIAFVKLGCAPYAVDQWALGERYWACDEFREWARARIRELKPDVLVLGARGMWAIETNDGIPDQGSWSTGVRTTLRDLTARAGRIVVVAGLGALAVSPAACLSDAQADLATCTTLEEKLILVANDLTRAAALRAGATYADLTTLACLRHRCPLVAERIVRLADSSDRRNGEPSPQVGEGNLPFRRDPIDDHDERTPAFLRRVPGVEQLLFIGPVGLVDDSPAHPFDEIARE